MVRARGAFVTRCPSVIAAINQFCGSIFSTAVYSAEKPGTYTPSRSLLQLTRSRAFKHD